MSNDLDTSASRDVDPEKHRCQHVHVSRDAYWEQYGSTSTLVFHGAADGSASPWPCANETFAPVWLADSTIITTDGLSCPWGDDDGDLGAGVEYYIDSPRLHNCSIGELQASWELGLLMRVVASLSEQRYRAPFDDDGCFALRVSAVDVPADWLDADGNLCLVLGVPSGSRGEYVGVGGDPVAVRLVAVTPVRPDELDWAVGVGSLGALARALTSSPYGNRVRLDRPSLAESLAVPEPAADAEAVAAVTGEGEAVPVASPAVSADSLPGEGAQPVGEESSAAADGSEPAAQALDELAGEPPPAEVGQPVDVVPAAGPVAEPGNEPAPVGDAAAASASSGSVPVTDEPEASPEPVLEAVTEPVPDFVVKPGSAAQQESGPVPVEDLPWDGAWVESRIQEHLVRDPELAPLGVVAPVPEEYFERFAGVLPASVLQVWRRCGFEGFGLGRTWITDPIAWAPVVEAWLDGVELPYPEQTWWCLTRTALGGMALWGEISGPALEIDPLSGAVRLCDAAEDRMASPIMRERMGAFLLIDPMEDFYEDEDSDRDLIDVAVERLGPVGADQVYGFMPPGAPVERLEASALSLQDASAHLVLLAQVTERRLEADVRRGAVGPAGPVGGPEPGEAVAAPQTGEGWHAVGPAGPVGGPEPGETVPAPQTGEGWHAVGPAGPVGGPEPVDQTATPED